MGGRGTEGKAFLAGSLNETKVFVGAGELAKRLPRCHVVSACRFLSCCKTSEVPLLTIGLDIGTPRKQFPLCKLAPADSFEAGEGTDAATVRLIQGAGDEAQIVTAIVESIAVPMVDPFAWFRIEEKPVHIFASALHVRCGVPRVANAYRSPREDAEPIEYLIVYQRKLPVRELNCGHTCLCYCTTSVTSHAMVGLREGPHNLSTASRFAAMRMWL